MLYTVEWTNIVFGDILGVDGKFIVPAIILLTLQTDVHKLSLTK